MDDLSKSSNESLLVFYENVRRQVDADIKSGGRYRFIGESVKQYADGTWRRNGPAAIAVYANRLAERTIDLARLRECDLPAGYLGGIFAIVSQRSTVQATIPAFPIRLNQIRAR
jgi:hypothetical protein